MLCVKPSKTITLPFPLVQGLFATYTLQDGIEREHKTNDCKSTVTTLKGHQEQSTTGTVGTTPYLQQSSGVRWSGLTMWPNMTLCQRLPFKVPWGWSIPQWWEEKLAVEKQVWRSGLVVLCRTYSLSCKTGMNCHVYPYAPQVTCPSQGTNE